jgi:hypothetical protein
MQKLKIVEYRMKNENLDIVNQLLVPNGLVV